VSFELLFKSVHGITVLNFRWQAVPFVGSCVREGSVSVRAQFGFWRDQSDGVIGSQLSLAVCSDVDRVDEVSGSDAMDAFECQKQDFEGELINFVINKSGMAASPNLFCIGRLSTQ
jgi:hypothetical protein